MPDNQPPEQKDDYEIADGVALPLAVFTFLVLVGWFLYSFGCY